MDRDYLLKVVRFHLSAHPEDAADVLAAVSDSLKDFAKSARQHRHVLADQGFLMMSANVEHKMSKWGCIGMTPMMMHQYPNGLSNHSIYEIQVWRRYLDAIREYGITEYREYLNTIWPTEVAWFNNYVLPTLNS